MYTLEINGQMMKRSLRVRSKRLGICSWWWDLTVEQGPKLQHLKILELHWTRKIMLQFEKPGQVVYMGIHLWSC